MLRRTVAVTLSGVLAAGLFLGSGAEAAAKKSTKKPVIKPALASAEARDVDLFEAMEAGDIDVRVVPNDPFSAKVLIDNKTEEPLNIKFPKAVVAAPILPQFGMGGMGGMGGGMGGMGGGMGGMGGGMGGMGGGMGGGQMMGGGMGGMGGGMGGMGMGGMGGMGGGGMGGMGGGFFSVPPEKIVSVPLNTVCLQHGKADPNRGMKYRLLPVETVPENPVLTELLAIVAAGKIDRQAAQAAAWHITDDMSWGQLASKEQVQINGTIGSYFNKDDLLAAQQLLSVAMKRAEANEKKEETDRVAPVIRRTSSSPRVSPVNRN